MESGGAAMVISSLGQKKFLWQKPHKYRAF